MSTLLAIDNAELAFGTHPLLDGAGMTIESGERIGLIGRNGTGKSSLLKIIAGVSKLDDGQIYHLDSGSVVMVEQEPVIPPADTLHASLLQRGGIPEIADERDRWRIEAKLSEFLHRFGCNELAKPESMSGGERKRAALALAMALGPNLLLLDEPTNHLDIDAIATLEDLLAKAGAAIIITHDRLFLDRVCTRIVELDRGLLRSYAGNFSAYTSRKADELAAEEQQKRKFDAFWQQEEAWIRQGIKARRTRNEGRVRRLEALRNERAERRERLGNVKLSIDSGERSGKLVAELHEIHKHFGDQVVVDNLSMRIMRGDRIGLIGKNGAGKSTLIKLILGQLAPDAGWVKTGTNLDIAYFDQMRAQLDPEKTVVETISPGSDWIEVNGGRKHVMSYLDDFLFPPARARAPVSTLSGGERNRLLLARLFARPANMVVLDEPTNDLDIESLELLETTLQEYTGTLLLVSHDRSFLDNVVTQTLVAEGEGRWQEYAGGYSDWLSQRPSPRSKAQDDVPTKSKPKTETAKSARKKLGYKEARELEMLPAEIEALEREQSALVDKMSDPDYHNAGADVLVADAERAQEIETLLDKKFMRWAELDELNG